MTMNEVEARLEALEEWVLGELDPIGRKRYLARLEELLGRTRRVSSRTSSGE